MAKRAEPAAEPPAPPSNAAAPFGWRAVLPLRWLPSYRREWLLRDVVSGVTLAAYAIPVSLAYATLAGLRPEYGVYCYLVGGLAYALFGSGRQIAIGPTSAISLLVGSTIAGMAAGDPVRAAQIAALTALVVAAVSFVAWALNASSLVSFISETLLLGFKAGAALTIAMTQLPKLLGVPGGGGGFFERAWVLITQVPQTNAPVLLFGLAAIAALVAGDRLFPARPVALVVVIAAIVALTVTPLASMGFKTVGLLPSGLPSIGPPPLNAAEADDVLPLAFACFLLAYIEGISAARALAERHGDEVDARQELFALGAANLATGLAHGYPVAGGLSQSTVNDKAGARSPLSLVFASVTIGLCLMFLTGLIRNLPDVVLAAIVLVAVSGLIDVKALKRVYRLSRMEFWVAMVAVAGVLMLGILKGVLIAAIVSMLLVIRRVANPHVARLGRIPGTQRYSDLARHHDNEEIPDVVIVRVESGLLYFNVDHVRARIREHIAAGGPGLRAVVWDLSTSPYVDISGAKLVGDIQRELAPRGVRFRVAEAHSWVRALLRKEIGVSIGEVSRRNSVDDVVTEELRLRSDTSG
jgi:high affinity sulfate transporter 1